MQLERLNSWELWTRRVAQLQVLPNSYIVPYPYTHVLTMYVCRVGQNHIYPVYIYGNFGRKITIYMVIYGAYVRFWPTLYKCLLEPLAFIRPPPTNPSFTHKRTKRAAVICSQLLLHIKRTRTVTVALVQHFYEPCVLSTSRCAEPQLPHKQTPTQRRPPLPPPPTHSYPHPHTCTQDQQ